MQDTINTKLDAPAFTGSEKQIAWALKIWEEFVTKMWAAVENTNRRVEYGSLTPQHAMSAYNAYQAIKSSVERDMGLYAGKWIDYKHNIKEFANRVDELADKYYTKNFQKTEA